MASLCLDVLRRGFGCRALGDGFLLSFVFA